MGVVVLWYALCLNNSFVDVVVLFCVLYLNNIFVGVVVVLCCALSCYEVTLCCVVVL